MEKNVIRRADNVEMKNIVTIQMEHAPADVILVIWTTSAKQVTSWSVL